MTTTRSLRLMLALGVPVLFGGCGHRKPSATIDDYGRYSENGRIRPEKGTGPLEPGGISVVVTREKGERLLEQTDQIPGKVGEMWGFRFRCSYVPVGRPCHVLRETYHPPIKRPDGTVRTKTVSESMLSPDQSPDGFYGWCFLKGHEHELVPGEWTLVVFINYVEVARKSFNITNGPVQPGGV
jgi:hypothetical protein